MPKGCLSNYFQGVASKQLTAVETDPERSNQHEYQGVDELRGLFGSARQRLGAHFIYLGGSEEDALSESGFLTWYNAREHKPQRSAEYHLYYSSTAVSEVSRAGDLLVVGTREDGTVMVIVVAAGSTYERQVSWLFGLPESSPLFSIHEIENERDIELGFAASHILNLLGIEVEKADETWLDRILKKFRSGFPATKLFSAFARQTLSTVSPAEDPDETLIGWLEHEEMLFRTLEKHIISERLKEGFNDVDDFITYSLSVQNRRKSRVGYALENHLEEIFQVYGVTYSRGQETENKAKPDFIFPGITHYMNKDFPQFRLTMLGVKSTCKDRWRQVLSEAARIKTKHLFTLEPSISENQTEEMKAQHVRLVVPKSIHLTYKSGQQSWLCNLDDFISIVRKKQ